jgi:CubicO group peptidase (beta-lactamase class C family)
MGCALRGLALTVPQGGRDAHHRMHRRACPPYGALAALLFALGCGAERPTHASAARSSTQDLSPTFPREHWERIDPEAAGFSRARLEAVREQLESLGTTSMMVVVGGRDLFEYGDTSRVSYLASIRKSVLAILYGNYVASGAVHLDATLGSLGIGDIGGLSDQEKEATVLDLMTARSGVYHPASNPGDNLSEAPARDSQKHGTYFLYNNWDFNVLGTIFEGTTRRSVYDALESDLTTPIGAEDFRRSAQHKEGDSHLSIHLAYHMWLSTRDMARIGLLMLREGVWRGRQIVPRAWVKTITTPFTRLEQMNPERFRHRRFGYGYLWWIFDDTSARGGGPLEGAFTGIGAKGQFITVIPKLDMVIAHKTDPKEGREVSSGEFLKVVDEVIAARLSAR